MRSDVVTSFLSVRLARKSKLGKKIKRRAVGEDRANRDQFFWYMSLCRCVCESVGGIWSLI